MTGVPEQCQIPDLSFPEVGFGKYETPWNLNVLLYKGGADTRTDLVQQLIVNGELGNPQLERINLVVKLHNEIKISLGGGGSRETAVLQCRCLRYLFGFADRTSLPLNLETVIETYCAWADWLFHRASKRRDAQADVHRSTRAISMRSAYFYGATIGTLIERILERHAHVVEMTRLRHQNRRKTVVGVQAEKQSLSDTFAFGHLLQDLCDGLTTSVILEAPLPVQIVLRNGKTITRKLSRGVAGWERKNLSTEQEMRLGKV